MIDKIRWVPECNKALRNYFDSMVGMFFKILPMRENKEASLHSYLCSLQSELLGCSRLLQRVDCDARIISLVSILEYFIENPDADVAVYRREVFKAIGICNKLKAHHTTTNARRGG